MVYFHPAGVVQRSRPGVPRLFDLAMQATQWATRMVSPTSFADWGKRAQARGWTVTHRLSDNDTASPAKTPSLPGRYRTGYEKAVRLVDAHAVDVVLCWTWDRFIREPLDLEYLIPRFDKAGCGSPRRTGPSTWAPTGGVPGGMRAWRCSAGERSAG